MVTGTFFLTLLSTLGIAYFLLGLYASRGITTNEDYFLAGRSLGLWPVTFTLVATQLGGGLLLGTSAEAYTTGYYGMFYSLGMAIGFFVLGAGFASKMRDFNIATMPELFEKRYESPALRRIASIISALSLCGITAGLVVSSRALMLGLGMNGEFVLVAFWVLVILYTIIGGLKAVVLTDIVQVLLIIAVFSYVFFVTLVGEPTGFFSLRGLVIRQGFFNAGDISFTGYFLMPLLFSLIEQDLAQRFFACKTKKMAMLSAIFAGIGIILVTIIPVYFGMKARLLGLSVPTGASPLIVILQHLTSETVIAFVVCAILAAVVCRPQPADARRNPARTSGRFATSGPRAWPDRCSRRRR